jgi:hypothetical protein
MDANFQILPEFTVHTQINVFDIACYFVWSSLFYRTLTMCQLISVCGPVSIPISSAPVFLTYVSENGAEVLALSQNYEKRILTLPWMWFRPSLCLSVSKTACLSVCLFICLSVWLAVCLSICMYVCMYVFMYVLLTCFPHKITRFPQKEFHIFLFKNISKPYYENSTLIKIRQE